MENGLATDEEFGLLLKVRHLENGGVERHQPKVPRSDGPPSAELVQYAFIRSKDLSTRTQ